MNEKQKLFRTIRLMLQFGCLTYVALIIALMLVWFLGD